MSAGGRREERGGDGRAAARGVGAGPGRGSRPPAGGARLVEGGLPRRPMRVAGGGGGGAGVAGQALVQPPSRPAQQTGQRLRGRGGRGAALLLGHGAGRGGAAAARKGGCGLRVTAAGGSRGHGRSRGHPRSTARQQLRCARLCDAAHTADSAFRFFVLPSGRATSWFHNLKAAAPSALRLAAAPCGGAPSECWTGWSSYSARGRAPPASLLACRSLNGQQFRRSHAMRRCGGPLFRAASALAGRGAGLERALAPLHTSATAAARGAWPTFGGSDHDAPAAQLGRSQRACVRPRDDASTGGEEDGRAPALARAARVRAQRTRSVGDWGGGLLMTARLLGRSSARTRDTLLRRSPFPPFDARGR